MKYSGYNLRIIRSYQAINDELTHITYPGNRLDNSVMRGDIGNMLNLCTTHSSSSPSFLGVGRPFTHSSEPQPSLCRRLSP